MVAAFKYIYGPVYSWRLGKSLGVDPLSGRHKICNMDCVYCQLGRTPELSYERKEYVPLEALLEEIKSIPPFLMDHITFSGRGEPTLAKNLGAMIRGVKEVRQEKVAVITNSILLNSPEVREDLMAADFVLAKLDATCQKTFELVSGCGLDYTEIIKGMLEFRDRFKGRFALQVMLINDNFDGLATLSDWASLLRPHEVQLNTPLRACSRLPLGRDRLQAAKEFFKGLTVVSCYDRPMDKAMPLDEKATATRHGHNRKNHL